MRAACSPLPTDGAHVHHDTYNRLRAEEGSLEGRAMHILHVEGPWLRATAVTPPSSKSVCESRESGTNRRDPPQCARVRLDKRQGIVRVTARFDKGKHGGSYGNTDNHAQRLDHDSPTRSSRRASSDAGNVGGSRTVGERRGRSHERGNRVSSRSPRGRTRGERAASGESDTSRERGSSDGSAFGHRSRDRHGEEGRRYRPGPDGSSSTAAFSRLESQSPRADELNNEGRGQRSGDESAGGWARGDRVEARYRGRGTKFYKGRISRINSDKTMDIAYDDGKQEIGIAAEHVRSLEPTVGDRGGRASKMAKGDRVEARYRGKGTRFYKGKISRVNSDQTFDIAYNDGEKEVGIAAEHVRSLEPAMSDGGGISGSKMARGDRVEARYRGKGTRFYKGKISRVNSDQTFDIAYNDGEKEVGIAAEHVRSLEPAMSDGGGISGSKMARGDRVEARYRGKGTRFYKGKISRVNSDQTFDIAYDDGEKEVGIAAEHVRSLEPAMSDGGGISGSKMARGDRVEARYRGKGIRFYKGKISRVNSDQTFDIAYDDGEKEVGIAAEHVRSLEPAMSDGGGISGSKMARGDRVEARYRGKGIRFYKGKISRVNSDQTFDIAYDDGEKEVGIATEHVRSLEPAMSDGGSGTGRQMPVTLLEGDKVEANFRGRGRFYPGRISRVNLDGSFNIDYSDGEKERGVTADLIRARGGTTRDEVRSGADTRVLEKGDRVEARYRGKGTRFYKGKISRVNSDQTLDISYDDGEKEIGIAAEHVRSLEAQTSGHGGGDRGRETSEVLLKEGMKVEAKYKGRSRYYPGRISRVHRDGSCDIDYDDGEKERLVDPSLVRVLESGKGGERTGSGDRLEEGMKVEAKYKGRSRYYPGRISRVHRDGSCDIDYDDGEKERLVDPSLVRVLESGKGGERTGSGDRLEEGMKVEAKYKGRSRYYPGRISRVHRDGSCDIDYDDGEKERLVDPSLVRVLESGKGGERTGSGDRLEEGMKVEAKYKGRSRYYPGRISRVHRDGSCDIDYDDGEKERLVDPSLVRVLESGKGGERTGSGDRLEEGMKVEAKYKGRSRYYPGRISRVHRDGSCDIDYDDGEKERLVDPSLVRVLESGKGGERTGSGDRLEEGMKVEAKYKGRSRYYPGRISRVHRDGSCDIDYDDGEKERLVDPSLVRVLESGKGGERTGSGDRLEEGMKVEAKYKGRSRYYPGRISRVHRDGSCDIDYDDGEKERLVDPSLVRVLESGKGERTGSIDPGDVGGTLQEGDRVEANYRRSGRYYPGRISRVHRDGSCDIDYDDGEREARVATTHVREKRRSNTTTRSRSGEGVQQRRRSSDDMEDLFSEGDEQGNNRRRTSRERRKGNESSDNTRRTRSRSRSVSRGGDLGATRQRFGGGSPRGMWLEGKILDDEDPHHKDFPPSIYGGGKDRGGVGAGVAIEGAEGEVLACHGDETFTIKYSDGQTEEDVPESCVRAAAAAPRGRSRDRRSASRGRRDSRPDEAGSGVWRAVERMSNELARRAGVERKKVSSSMLEREKDEVLKTDMVLGRSESARFRREFNKADFSRDGELTTADTVRAFRGLGGKATENEVREFLRATDGAGRSGGTGGHHRLDFPAFVQAYAWVFYRGGSTDESDSNGDPERNGDDDSGSSSSYRTKERGRRRTARSSSRAGTRTSGERLTSRKLGYRSPEKSSSRRRSQRQGGGLGIGEEAELRRWAKRLGEKQMRRLERVFNEWAVEDDGSDGDGATVEVRDLERCFKELGRDDVQRRELRAWCDGADLAPGDTLSLADFAYAYHSMFVDTTGEEVAAAIFQSEKWEGTAEQHDDLIRRVSVGRSGEQAAMLARARQVFEELDEDRDGEIPRKVIGKFLTKVGRDPKTCATQIAAFCRGGFIADTSGGRPSEGRNGHQHGQRQERRGRTGFAAGDKGATEAETKSAQRREMNSRGGTEWGRQQHQRVAFAEDYGDDGGLPAPSSSASLAEILAAFGFVFEGAGAAVKPSVAEAFAKLRLHAQPAEARAAGEAAKRCMAALN
ncbi:unnamed protein product [Ectocarpus sp. CCAP 1310/34]|nr:unnamed protein product [Ectocarpus sp. CCAP 1310/34]